MRPKKTRLLKLEYQRVSGTTIGVRQWQKIKLRLGIKDDEDLTLLPMVKAYATLRRKAPRIGFTRKDAEQYIWLAETLPRLQCNGKQLKTALLRLKPQPSLQTIYRWGREVGTGFSVHQIYTPSDLEKWLEKVLTSRFHFETYLQKTQTTQT